MVTPFQKITGLNILMKFNLLVDIAVAEICKVQSPFIIPVNLNN